MVLIKVEDFFDGNLSKETKFIENRRERKEEIQMLKEGLGTDILYKNSN